MALSIHLGAHKTASTHLQYSLRQVRDRLAQAGLFYADPGTLRDVLPLSQALARGEGCPAELSCRRQFQAAREGFADLLISEENILGGTHRSKIYSQRGTLYPRAPHRLRRVIDMAGGGPATLYLALRDPAGFHVSAFALQLSEGNEIELDAYMGGRDPARAPWSGLVKRLKQVEGVGRIVVWRYEDYAALRPELLARLLPEGMAGSVPEPEPRNVSITQPGYDWFVAQAMADNQADLRDLFRQARQKFPRRKGHPRLRLLDEAAHERSAGCYRAEIEALARMPGVELLLP
ncbi:hypothetical protein [Paracoccus sp. KR1-242]|uniref:hypothetical protein n=1 Tax=Paracoccus sp. KR1-242 TaxID=3410028 RepID=UPI003C0F7F75